MFEYDTLAFKECHVIVVSSSAFVGYMEQVTMTTNDSISVCLISCNKLPNSKIKLSVRIDSCMKLSFHSSIHSKSHLSCRGGVASLMTHRALVGASK